MDNYQNPKPGKTYFSPSMKSFGESERRVRIVSKVLDQPEAYAFAQIKEELVLRHKEDAKTNIRATFFEDDRSLRVLTIQGYTVASDKPHNASFSFIGDEISRLLEFVANIHSVEFKGQSGVTITDTELRRIALSKEQARLLVEGNEELIAEALRSTITKEDLIAVGYRKKQLSTFHKLLNDSDYFDNIKSAKALTDESLWQRFFEKNPWIFGYGLSYLYLSTLDEKKLEQFVQGHSISTPGKRVDALMRTRGVISSLCFVEIKTHKTPLLGKKTYRSGCWAPSTELSGAIAQAQGTVSAAMDTIRAKLALTDPNGFPTGTEAFNFSPKAFLLAGSLSQFVNDSGTNIEQFRSFELLRRTLNLPEIVTYDELYERAKFIVEASES